LNTEDTVAAVAAIQAVIRRWQVAIERAKVVTVAIIPGMGVTVLDTAHMKVVDQTDMVDMQAPTWVVVMVRRAATANMEEAEGNVADTKGVRENVATISTVGAWRLRRRTWWSLS